MSFRKFLAANLLLFSIVAIANAATKISKSPMSWRTFWNCETAGVRGICLPFVYAYDGLVTVKYTSTYDSRRRVNVVTIQEVNQSVSMYGAANSGNPCGAMLGISVDVYDYLGRRVTTLYGSRSGSYIIGRGTLHYGRVSNPNITVLNPTFKAKAVAGSTRCFNLPATLSWSFNIP